MLISLVIMVNKESTASNGKPPKLAAKINHEKLSHLVLESIQKVIF